MKKIREFLESIVFAGLKPSGGQAAPKKDFKWLGPLQGPVERLLSGGPAPTDPLYLTNRSFGQKMRAWSLIGIPCLILATGIGVVLYMLEPPEPKPIKDPSAAEITAKIPNMDKEIKLAPPSEVQVVEIKVDGTHISGIVQNTTKHDISTADLVVDLTNSAGSQVGAVSCTVEKIPAGGRKDFELAIKQRDAVFALVREISSK